MPNITAIKQQVKQTSRYSVFVDGAYSFSLSEQALLDSKLVPGQALDAEQIEEYKQLSADDKLYNRTLRYVAMRPRSRGEVLAYLARKNSPAPLSEQITNKLESLDLINDRKLAQAYVNDRQLLRPASRRKIIAELKKKYISDDIIEAVVGGEGHDERAALREIITRKRRQTKYQDELKLMQYLARQGFSYDDIKAALRGED